MASITRPASFAAAERLEEFLGDPADPHAPFGYAASAALDDIEAFPADACAALDRYGLPGHYVPVRYGGTNTSYEEAVQLLRVAPHHATVPPKQYPTTPSFLPARCLAAASTSAITCASFSFIR